MERVAYGLHQEGYKIRLTSRFSFWLYRAVNHLWAILFTNYKLAFVDVFSDRSFILAEWSCFWLKLLGKRYILTLRGGKLSEFDKNNQRRVDRVFQYASLIQTPSLFLKEHFENRGYAIAYIPNPVNLNHFTFKPRGQSGYKILWVRAFSPIYNPHIAVLVLKQLANSYPSVTLTMIGPDRGLLTETKSLITSSGLSESVNILGPVGNEHLTELYHSHDIFINTTSYESFGVAVVEAASCGIPIVSFSVGEIPYIWTHEHDALLCEPGQADQMAEQVVRLFSDKMLVQKLVSNARLKSQEFSWDKIKNQWIALLKNGVASF